MRFLVLVVALLTTPAVLDAQTRLRGFEASLGYGAWSGVDAESIDPGIVGALAFLVETAPHVGFGPELTYARYEQFGRTINDRGANLVGRLALGDRSEMHVFAQFRIGWTQLSSSIVTQNGVALGPELGMEIPLTDAFRLVGGAWGTWRSYEGVQGVIGVLPGAESSGNAYQYGVRLGLSLGQVFW